MNYIKQVAEMLGVEVGEEFKISDTDETLTFHFDEHGLKSNRDVEQPYLLSSILNGRREIVKIPFKPKCGEEYWTCLFIKGGYIALETWCDCSVDYCHWKLGNCFRTREEAEIKGRAIMKKIKAEYDGE
ncbi:MAG: hypothetical protein KBT35_01360 [Firmicutes bacterium]|nr:hypothetical protein [Candidatus Colivicinus equi]